MALARREGSRGGKLTNHSESSASGSTSAGHGGSAPAGETGQDNGHQPRPLTSLSKEFAEYLTHYLNARTDRLKLAGRQALFGLGLGIVALLVLAGAGIVAVTLLFIGVAQGLAQLLGNRPWLGNLAGGGLLLAGISLAVWACAARQQRIARERTVEKYEHRKRQQQEKFGRNVAEQAAVHRDE